MSDRYLIFVDHPESGSSTSIGSETVVGCLEAAIDWLGGEYRIERGRHES